MRSVNPGFRSAKYSRRGRSTLPGSRYPTPAQLRALDERVLAALSVLPRRRVCCGK